MRKNIFTRDTNQQKKSQLLEKINTEIKTCLIVQREKDLLSSGNYNFFQELPSGADV